MGNNQRDFVVDYGQTDKNEKSCKNRGNNLFVCHLYNPGVSNVLFCRVEKQFDLLANMDCHNWMVQHLPHTRNRVEDNNCGHCNRCYMAYGPVDSESGKELDGGNQRHVQLKEVENSPIPKGLKLKTSAL